jgi:hypothetical protein
VLEYSWTFSWTASILAKSLWRVCEHLTHHLRIAFVWYVTPRHWESSSRNDVNLLPSDEASYRRGIESSATATQKPEKVQIMIYRNTNVFLEIRYRNVWKYQLESLLFETIWPLCKCLLFMVKLKKRNSVYGALFPVEVVVTVSVGHGSPWKL